MSRKIRHVQSRTVALQPWFFKVAVQIKNFCKSLVKLTSYTMHHNLQCTRSILQPMQRIGDQLHKLWIVLGYVTKAELSNSWLLVGVFYMFLSWFIYDVQRFSTRFGGEMIPKIGTIRFSMARSESTVTVAHPFRFPCCHAGNAADRRDQRRADARCEMRAETGGFSPRQSTMRHGHLRAEDWDQF